MQKTLLTFTLILITTLTAVYLFIGIAIIPFWQTLSGIEIQVWFRDHFVRFPTMMNLVHILSTISMTACYIVFRKSDKRTHLLALTALIFLILCEATYPLIYADANAALSSVELSPEEALTTLDGWTYWHPIRTLFTGITLLCLGIMNTRQ